VILAALINPFGGNVFGIMLRARPAQPSRTQDHIDECASA
jgi:hypothetical protein